MIRFKIWMSRWEVVFSRYIMRDGIIKEDLSQLSHNILFSLEECERVHKIALVDFEIKSLALVSYL